jgi:flagellar hook-associated protein 1 FlgK
MGFSGLSIATSGLRVAHTNLGVTGHNMANAEIRGFSRQRIVQKEAMVKNLGVAPNGDRMIVGMGADRNAVQQLRNEFLDFTYRTQVGRLSFYSTVVAAGREIENLLGELYGAYNFQSVVNEMWFAIQELSRHPDGFATRQVLLSTANSFLNKSREVYLGLVEEQHNLNHQVIQTVNDINNLVSRVNSLNELIRRTEIAGDNANDFRDQRNLALDQLAELIPIDVRTNAMGDKNITSAGHELLNSGNQSLLGLRFVSSDYNFVVPVLGTGGQTIPSTTPPGEFVNFMHLYPIDYANGNDFGKLNGLLLARGMAPANYKSGELLPPPQRLIAFEDALVDAWRNANWAAIEDDEDIMDAIDIAFPMGSAHPLWAAFIHARTNMNDSTALIDFYNEVQEFMNDPASTGAQIAALQNVITALGEDWTNITYTHTRYIQYRDHLDEHLNAEIYNHQLHVWSIEYAMIPRVQQSLDSIVHSMVTMLNDALTGKLREVNPNFNPDPIDPDENPHPGHPNFDLLDGGRYRFIFACTDDTRPGYPFNYAEPWNLNSQQTGTPLFVRRYGTGPVDPSDINSLYTIENLRINPLLLEQGGHNLLALSLDRDTVNDTRVLEALQNVWRFNSGPYIVEIGGRPLRVQDAYVRLVGQIATDVNEALRFTDAQRLQVIQADNQRMAIKGVSMDEELAAMLRFQYAFQAASRVINVIDSMIGILVNIGRN